MISLDELKPIIEPLIDGRDDVADIIEAITALDKEVEVDRSEIDALNKSWNDRFMAQFFGAKAENMDESIPEEAEVIDATADVTDESVAMPEASEDTEIDGDNITIEDLFKEDIVK